MDKVRELIRSIVEERNLSMAALSTGGGKNRAYLQQFIERESPKRLPEDFRVYLAGALEIEESRLRGTGRINPQMLTTPSPPKKGASGPRNSVTNEAGAELLKVLGMAEGGPDGWNLWNGDVVQTINRPDNLIGVKGAYGVLVRGTSMSPRYDPNMIAHVHPWMEPAPGDYVVVQRKPLHEGDPPLAVLKRLVRRTARIVVLASLSPAKEMEVPAGEVVSIHVVVGSSNA
jgi:phage repressor protein C with HTH and peptisase S24 domain